MTINWKPKSLNSPG